MCSSWFLEQALWCHGSHRKNINKSHWGNCTQLLMTTVIGLWSLAVPVFTQLSQELRKICLITSITYLWYTLEEALYHAFAHVLFPGKLHPLPVPWGPSSPPPHMASVVKIYTGLSRPNSDVAQNLFWFLPLKLFYFFHDILFYIFYKTTNNLSHIS